MPQLEVSTFLPQLVWLAITFVLLYLLMARIGLPRVGGIIEARRRRIDDDLARAAQLKSEAEGVMAAYQRPLPRPERKLSRQSRRPPAASPPKRPRASGSSARRWRSRQRRPSGRLPLPSNRHSPRCTGSPSMSAVRSPRR